MKTQHITQHITLERNGNNFRLRYEEPETGFFDEFERPMPEPGRSEFWTTVRHDKNDRPAFGGSVNAGDVGAFRIAVIPHETGDVELLVKYWSGAEDFTILSRSERRLVVDVAIDHDGIRLVTLQRTTAEAPAA